jgi:hypothetical protein
MRVLRAFQVVLIAALTLLASTFATAQTLPVGVDETRLSDIPADWRAWVPWALRGAEREFCPHTSGTQFCVWPATVDLVADRDGFSFAIRGHSWAESAVRLPMIAGSWPQTVRVASDSGVPMAFPVLADASGLPVVQVPAGDFVVIGQLPTPRPPESIRVDDRSALVRLTENGQTRVRRVEDDGTIWLRRETEQTREQDRVTVEVFRLLTDGVPLQLTTTIKLRVSGQPRELEMGQVLAEGFIPHSVTSPLPTRVDDNGALRAQLRAGTWEIELGAHSLENLPEAGGTFGAEPWPEVEYWSFVVSDVRSVRVDGAPGVDPARTDIPQQWRGYPAFMVTPDANLILTELRRGEANPPPDQVNVSRQFWIDGDGLTASDSITGRLSTGGRINAVQGELGRAQVSGQGRVITADPETGLAGVELRALNLNLATELQYDSASTFPAVGYNRDAGSLSATLNIPPGWTVWSVDGPDDASGTWMRRWSLLDLFVLVLIVLAIRQYAGNVAAVVALVSLGLSWHESGAVRYLWFAVVVAGMLALKLPAGKFRIFCGRLAGGTIALVVLLSLVFAGGQARNALFPHLESRGYSYSAPGFGARSAPMVEAPMNEPEDLWQDGEFEGLGAEDSIMQNSGGDGARAGRPASGPIGRSGDLAGYSSSAYREVDPSEVVQTGAGIPTWTWSSVQLIWNGPVTADSEVSVLATGPVGSGLVRLLRGIGMLALALLCLMHWRTNHPTAPTPSAPNEPATSADSGDASRSTSVTPVSVSAATALLILLASILVVPAAGFAQAGAPDASQIQEMRNWLTARPTCADGCVNVSSLAIDASGTTVEMIAEVHAQAAGPWVIPGPASTWTPSMVDIEGADYEYMRRAGGHLVLWVPEGVHTIRLSGPALDSMSLAFASASPRYLTFSGSGWTLEGYTPGQPVRDSIQLIREVRDVPDGTDDEGIDETESTNALPSWVALERVLYVGLNWRMVVTATNLRPGSSVLLRIPLLEGENVTSAGIEVEDGVALLQLGSGDASRTFETSLETRETLQMTAATEQPWTETWRLDCSTIWQCAHAGLSPTRLVDSGGAVWSPMWNPWADESVELSFVRPQPAAGTLVTVDSVTVEVESGRDLRDVTMTSIWRASGSGEHSITLSESAVLQSFSVDGRDVPVSPDAGRIGFTLEPGSHNVVLTWREPAPQGFIERTPSITLSAGAVNTRVNYSPSRRRWVLWTGGPAWGPVVTMWQYVIGMVLAALLLARFLPFVPMGALGWFVLGIGTSQTDGAGLLMVVLWLALLGWRGGQKDLTSTKTAFALLGIAFMTLVAFGCLLAAIASGLALHPPDMGIRGGGSYAGYLSWYQARSGTELPVGWTFTVPLWVWHTLMLAWSLWVAWRFIGWARWGWEQVNAGALWRKREVRAFVAPTPPPGPTGPPAPMYGAPLAPGPAPEPAPAPDE